MELSFLNDNLTNPAVLLPAIRKAWKPYFELKAFQEYDPLFKGRKINDRGIRRDKVVKKKTGEMDSLGNPITAVDIVKKTRLAIPFQQLIVEQLTAFITGGGCTLSAKPSDAMKPLFEAVKGVWSGNKVDFRNGNIVRALLSQLECAEIWYSKVENGKVKLKFKVYAPADGYKLMPVFDSSDDLIAFGIEYTRKDETGKSVVYHDLFTATQVIMHRQDQGVDTIISTTNHRFGKIPVVYYQQDRSAWQNVQCLIDRLEVVISNFCDTNDYFGSPMLAIIGQIMESIEKGETGQGIQLEEGADAKYITWTQVPEAIKYEIETLVEKIYACVQCPDLSFSKLAALKDATGPAFDRIMISAHLKSRMYHNGIYGEGVQRRLNFLVSAQASIMGIAADLDITPNFRLFKINDQRELVDMLLLANGNKPLISQADSVEQAGLSDNTDETMVEIRSDEEREAQLQIMVAGHAQDTSAAGVAGSKTKPDNAMTKQTVRMSTKNAQNASAA